MNKKIALLLFSSILFVGCNTQPITSEVVNNELTDESLKKYFKWIYLIRNFKIWIYFIRVFV